MSAARGFTSVPNVIVRDATIPPTTRLLYGVILSYAWGGGRCTASTDTLCGDTGIGRSAFFEGVALLRERGLLEVRKVKSKNGWRNFYVPIAPGFVVPDGDPDEGRPEDGQRVVRDPDGGSSATQPQKKTKVEEEVETDVSTDIADASDSPLSVSYRGKRVPTAVTGAAVRAVRRWGERTEQTVRVFDAQRKPTTSLTRVIGAMQSFPEVVELYEAMIDAALRDPWWRDARPGVGVVFGPNVVERMIAAAKGEGGAGVAATAPRRGGGPTAQDFARIAMGE